MNNVVILNAESRDKEERRNIIQTNREEKKNYAEKYKLALQKQQLKIIRIN